MRNRYDVIFSHWVVRYRCSLAALRRMSCGLRRCVKTETGSRIPLWRMFLFLYRSNYISAVNWVMSTNSGSRIDFDVLDTATSTNTKPEVKLKINMTSLLSRTWPYLDKIWQALCRKHAENGMWSWTKSEKEFQYDGRLFYQTGNSYISAADWIIMTKFGMLIDIDFMKKVTSPNPKPEVKLRHTGRHLKNRYDIITAPRMVWFGWNLADWCTMTWRLHGYGRDRNQKKNFSMADVCYSKPEIVIF